MQQDKRGLDGFLQCFMHSLMNFIKLLCQDVHSTIWDVLIFDNFGAMLSLWIVSNRDHNT